MFRIYAGDYHVLAFSLRVLYLRCDLFNSELPADLAGCHASAYNVLHANFRGCMVEVPTHKNVVLHCDVVDCVWSMWSRQHDHVFELLHCVHVTHTHTYGAGIATPAFRARDLSGLSVAFPPQGA